MIFHHYFSSTHWVFGALLIKYAPLWVWGSLYCFALLNGEPLWGCGAYFLSQSIFVFLSKNLSRADILIIVLMQHLAGPPPSDHMLLGGEQGCFIRGIWCRGVQHLLILTGQSRHQQNGRVDRLRARRHPGHLCQDGVWGRGPCSSCQVRCTCYSELTRVYWLNLYDTLNKMHFVTIQSFFYSTNDFNLKNLLSFFQVPGRLPLVSEVFRQLRKPLQRRSHQGKPDDCKTWNHHPPRSGPGCEEHGQHQGNLCWAERAALRETARGPW